MATGIEIAGLVLGAFPLILSCLDYYREGMEPLEEWWSFRTHFIEFVDSINHQMMKYQENMTRLLDPIIADNDTLAALIRDSTDTRWSDGTLDDPLERRLASECDRFFRIVERMEKVVKDLKRLLQIDGDLTSWEWQLTRIKISFSKGKHKKVRKLADHNRELQEILGYSERIIHIIDNRRSSAPVTLFDKVRRHACSVHNILSQRWKCHSQKCQPHQAHLGICVATKEIRLSILFVIGGEQGPPQDPLKKQEVVIQPSSTVSSEVSSAPISYVHQATCFTAVQEKFEETAVKHTPRLSKLFRTLKKTPLEPSSSGSNIMSQAMRKNVAFAPSVPVIRINKDEIQPGHSLFSPPPLIQDICSFLQAGQTFKVGIIEDESNLHLKLSKSFVGPAAVALDTAKLVSLPELLNAHHRAEIVIPRQDRFAMASHIASALLQVHTSPWLSRRWSKRDFSFVIDSGRLCNNYPYVSETFLSEITDVRGSAKDTTTLADHSFPEETRSCLFTVGVIILELVFGQNIESCSFRKYYYGPDNMPNDQTDISTARRWAKTVLGECGADIDDVVRRCLDCSFGPKPSFTDVRFKEAVYEGVIKPLVDYSKVWPEVVPLS
ncbi:unnamed protein product [Aspergillus oryzae]|nr:unnamed protein product [Aspergillus oryzae]GMF87722.1 unnamed protein product [Aspergillus oryzae]